MTPLAPKSTTKPMPWRWTDQHRQAEQDVPNAFKRTRLRARHQANSVASATAKTVESAETVRS